MAPTDTAVDVNSPPKFFAVWKSNIPIVIQSVKLHPLLLGGLAASCLVHAVFPLAGFLASVGAMICLAFIDYTTMVAVWSNINDGAPKYDVTNSDVQWKMVLTLVMVNIVSFLLTLLLILPGIWFAVKSSFSSMMVCLEGRNSQDAISRSHNLTKGNFLLTFWFRALAPALMILPLFISLVIGAVIITIPVALVSKDAAEMLRGPMLGIYLMAFYLAYLTMIPPLVHLYAYLNAKNA